METALVQRQRDIVGQLNGHGLSLRFRHVASLAFVRGGGVALQFVSVIAVAWVLDEANAGTYFFAFSIAQLSAALARVGLDQSMVRNVPVLLHRGQHALVRGAFGSGVALGCGAAVIVALLSTQLAPAHVRLHLVFVIVAMVVMSVAIGVLQGLDHSRSFALLRDVVQPGAFLLWLVVAAPDARGALGGLAGSYLLSFVVALFLVLAALGVGSVRAPPRHVFGDAIALWPTSLLAQGLRWADTLVLGLIAGPLFLATFTPLSRAAALVTFPLTVVNVSFPQRIALLERLRNTTRMLALSRVATALSVLASSAIIVAIWPYLQALVPWIVPGTREPGAVVAFGVLIIGQLWSAASGPSGYTLMMTGLARFESRALLSGLAVYVGLAAATVPAYGIAAAAAAAAAMHALSNALRLRAIMQRLDLIPTGRHHVVAFAAVGSIIIASITLPTMLVVTIQAGLIGLITRETVLMVRTEPSTRRDSAEEAS